MPAHGATVHRWPGNDKAAPALCAQNRRQQACAGRVTAAKHAKKTRQNWSMYLLLAAHPSGAVLQELTQAGHPHPDNPEPRLASTSELADVVRGLERTPRA